MAAPTVMDAPSRRFVRGLWVAAGGMVGAGALGSGNASQLRDDASTALLVSLTAGVLVAAVVARRRADGRRTRAALALLTLGAAEIVLAFAISGGMRAAGCHGPDIAGPLGAIGGIGGLTALLWLTALRWRPVRERRRSRTPFGRRLERVGIDMYVVVFALLGLACVLPPATGYVPANWIAGIAATTGFLGWSTMRVRQAFGIGAEPRFDPTLLRPEDPRGSRTAPPVVHG